MADVFISYSRKDIAFARLLNAALGDSQLETWIDWARIPVGEKWWDEICAAIAQAEVFLFIISRNSVGSNVCRDEINEALSHNKRVIPVVVDDTPEAAIRDFVPDLTTINWVILRRDEAFALEDTPHADLPPEEQVAALPKEPQFRQALARLNEAIHTDWAWVKAQTRLEGRALEWDRHTREGSRLLRGKDLQEAEGWLAQAGPKKDPQPTELQRQYVLAGRRAESRRQRFVAMLSLGATAVISVCLVAALVFGLMAVQAQQTAERNLQRSESLRLAADAQTIMNEPDGNAETAALLSIRSLRDGYVPQADAPLQQSVAQLYAVRTFGGNAGAVNSVAMSPDGKTVLTGSADGVTRLFDTQGGKLVRSFDGKGGSVESVAMSPDGRYVAAGSADKMARVWETSSGALLHTLKTEHSSVERSAVDMKRSCHAVAFSPDSRLLLTGSDDGLATLWSVASGKETRTFSGHSGIVRGVTFSSDGATVLTNALDDTVRVWDPSNGAELRKITLDAWAMSIALSSDGRYLLTSGNGAPFLWDVTTGQRVRTFLGDLDPGISMAFSPNGRYAATASLGQKVVRIWDVSKGTVVRTLTGHTDTVMSVAFSPDGLHVLSGSLDSTAKLWDAVDQPEPRSLTGHTDTTTSVAFSRDGKYVVSGSGDRTARLWDVGTGAMAGAMVGHTGAVESVAISRDGKYLLTGSDDMTAKVWNASTGALVTTLTGHVDFVNSVAFSPDGKYALTGSADRTVRLWDAATGIEQRAFKGQTQGIVSVAFSPDGKSVAAGSADWTADVWDSQTGKLLHSFNCASSVEAVAFSPDGSQLVCGTYERIAQLWDLPTETKKRTFEGHASYIDSVAFSPDGKFVLTGSWDRTAKLWSVETGAEVRTISSPESVTSVAFSPDGKFIGVADLDGVVRIWDVAYQDTLTWACSHLTRDLTPAERAEYLITDERATCPVSAPLPIALGTRPPATAVAHAEASADVATPGILPTATASTPPRPSPRFSPETEGQHVYDWAHLMLPSGLASAATEAEAFAKKHGCDVWLVTREVDGEITADVAEADYQQLIGEWGSSRPYVLMVVVVDANYSHWSWKYGSVNEAYPADFWDTVSRDMQPATDALDVLGGFKLLLERLDPYLPGSAT